MALGFNAMGGGRDGGGRLWHRLAEGPHLRPKNISKGDPLEGLPMSAARRVRASALFGMERLKKIALLIVTLVALVALAAAWWHRSNVSSLSSVTLKVPPARPIAKPGFR